MGVIWLFTTWWEEEIENRLFMCETGSEWTSISVRGAEALWRLWDKGIIIGIRSYTVEELCKWRSGRGVAGSEKKWTTSSSKKLSMSGHQRGAVKGKVYGKLLPRCGSCLWWVSSQLSGGGGAGVNKVSILEEKLDPEQGRVRMKWNWLITFACLHFHICQQWSSKSNGHCFTSAFQISCKFFFYPTHLRTIQGRESWEM